MACICMSHMSLLLLLACEKTKLRHAFTFQIHTFTSYILMACLYLWRVYDVYMTHMYLTIVGMSEDQSASNSHPMYVCHTCTFDIFISHISHMYIHYTYMTCMFTLMADTWASSPPTHLWHKCTYDIYIYHVYHMYIHITLLMMCLYIIMADISEDESASNLPFVYLRHMCTNDVYICIYIYVYIYCLAWQLRRRKCASSTPPLYIWHTCTFKIHTYHIYHIYIYFTLNWHI